MQHQRHDTQRRATRDEVHPTMTPAIAAEGLRRTYSGGFEAVRGVSFDVERGELFALLGTNGAGKTSTMEMIEGLVPVSGGEIRVLGADPHRERATVRPRLGIMMQEGGFPSQLTVTEMAQMWAGTLSHPRPVSEAIDLVDLSHRAGVMIEQLSGGERRRLDLALAIAGRPEVLFLDEPTTGLDPESRRNTWELIRKFQAEGTTVVLTTHYLDEAEALADRLVIMNDGVVATGGTVAEVASSSPSTISFTNASGAVVPDLPGVLTVDNGRDTTLHTDHLQETLTALLDWARDNGVVLDNLDATTASLEQAFLAIADSHRAESFESEEVSA